MSTHNIQFHDKIGKNPKNIPKYLFSLPVGRNSKFLRDSKRVRISHGKRVIGVRVIKVLLYETTDAQAD